MHKCRQLELPYVLLRSDSSLASTVDCTRADLQLPCIVGQIYNLSNLSKSSEAPFTCNRPPVLFCTCLHVFTLS